MFFDEIFNNILQSYDFEAVFFLQVKSKSRFATFSLADDEDDRHKFDISWHCFILL